MIEMIGDIHVNMYTSMSRTRKTNILVVLPTARDRIEYAILIYWEYPYWNPGILNLCFWSSWQNIFFYSG